MVVEWLCPGMRPTGSRRPRILHCKVILLDEHELLQDVLSSNMGQELLDRVFRHLNLLETAYFGLRYLDHENQTWLDPSKKIGRQLKIRKGYTSTQDSTSDTHTLYFGVKFYAADPCKLIEEITRYQFFLQVKQDILRGRLPVSFDLAAELGAYVVQSELGDYDPRRHSPGYVTEFRFLTNQTAELEARIVELHKTFIGQDPSIAELNYLDKVKWLEMYGVDLHPVLFEGEDNVEYYLGLTPSGIILLRNKTKVGNYYWPRINKIYYKGRYFMLRVSEKNSEERTHGFETPSKGACRHLWKCCQEHQAFFRLMATGPPPMSPYSRFRSYSPPSEKHQQGSIRRNPPPVFQRTPSRRAQRRIVEGQEMVRPFIETPAVDRNTSINSANCNTRHISNSSPRSIRSAPWTQSRSLYTSSSPRSVRSAGTAPGMLNRIHRRSSSVESQSSGDSHSRSGHRRRSHSHSHRRHSRHSDCESELSRGSDSRSGHRKHRRKHRSSRNSRHELVDSEPQWREVQKQKAEGVQRAVVNVSHTEPRRRHRSRHRSPSQKLPHELRKHFEFGLIDTTGMTEQQRREIPYTVVQTQAISQNYSLSSNLRLDIDTTSSVRAIGTFDKKDKHVPHRREGNYDLLSTRSSGFEPNYTTTRTFHNQRKDYDSTMRNSRILIGSNADSGLGESTTQDFSSCCSSSADSTKITKPPHLQLKSEGIYDLSSNQEVLPIDATLDAVLQPILSTLTRRPKNFTK
ncbi:band 4.1-like protein 4 isoform X2 [Chelonus insularis]|uniref:band 4.1-like protein 4 isoform X2 n=1 Tax=Chelonus insularis TaxID=460826 RepID=UPI00158B337E|nr:band 4.1-like protein 4 isoform X2 [Chelonus insularis]